MLIGAIVSSKPTTEPIRPWVLITFFQSLLLLIMVYLPWIKSQMQIAGFPTISDRFSVHALDDGFMGREINGHSITRFLVLPLIIVGLCSWMLIITRGNMVNGSDLNDGAFQENNQFSNNYPSSSDDLVIKDGDKREDDRMVISMIILSSATSQGFMNRQLFRNSTLKLLPSPRNKAVVVKYRFIIGDSTPLIERELKQEHSLMGDLLIISVPDRPDSKSKKLYKAIEWADNFEFDYLVKTEDDVLVRMDTLAGELYKQGRKPYFWKGLVFKNVPNTRLDDMDLKEMPAFTDGTLTTLSRDIVRLLAVPAPRYFVASSAQSLGIWLHGYGIRPQHDIRIQPGAFVCEETLIAKHFDNEPSLIGFPRDNPVKMVERINRIRSEIKQNRNYKSTISICDPLIKKRCAICHSCQARTSNWKLMGFDCKEGGVVVGDKYRKPELLDAKQMDELLNRPPTGISESLAPAAPNYRPDSGIRQTSGQDDTQSIDDSVNSDEAREEVEQVNGDITNKDESTEDEQETEDDALEGQDEEEALDEEEQSQEDQDGSNSDLHDESELSISDNEVDYLDRRHDEDSLPPSVPKKKKKPSLNS
ncbi:UDP-Gal betaGal beta 1,3-galactosyltransferase, polypeptide 6 [Entomortierella beljakovae]|nr:UDP-Gal betaGal beta 1,3-galactosyltransferase, polypeptide 6 [Entomortierella beljakovae]